MKTRFLILTFKLLLMLYMFGTPDQVRSQGGGVIATTSNNYHTFTLLPEKNITAELDRLTPQEWKKHPDYGQLPYFAPCTNCVELIHKRTDSTRYFVENNTNGKKIYLQTGDPTMHFRDQNGQIRERLPNMFITEKPHVFRATMQAHPIEIDIPNQRVTFIPNEGKRLHFNQNLELWAVTIQGQKKKLSNASWKNGYTAGDNGVQIFDIFPNIDMEINNMREGVKTNFVVKNNNAHFEQYRYIFIKDDVFSGVAAKCEFKTQAHTENLYVSDAVFYNDSDTQVGTVKRGIVFDQGQTFQNDVFYEWDHGLNMYVHTDVFNDPTITFPVIIDPTIQLTSTLPMSFFPLHGSKYDATCWNPDEYCAYDLNVNFPPNVTFTNVLVQADIYAPWQSSTCPFTGGAFRVVTGDCIYPSGPTSSDAPDPPYFLTCAYLPNVNPMTHNVCYLGDNGSSAFTSLGTCLPAPACTTQTQVFSEQLFRCVTAGTGCTNNCIRRSKPFIVTVVGETLELPSITIEGGSTNSIVCKGDTVTISPDDNFGVPPYTYLWSPGGETSASITDIPQTTGTYSVTVTDACNNTLTISKLVTVIPISHDTLKQVICQSALPFTWEEKTVDQPGEHTLIDSTILGGCLSTKTLLLTAHPGHIIIDSTICSDLLPFSWQGHTVNAEGKDTLEETVVVQGCTIGTTINLTVDPVIRLNIDSTECVTEYPFIWQGYTIHESGSHVLSDTNVATNGCDSITTLYLFLQCDVIPPNVLSLSSKEGNKEWFVEEGGFTEFHCIIVNRWGNVVFELNDAKQKWIGEDSKGNKLSEGVYFYTLKVKYKDGQEATKQGFIHLID